MDQKLHLDSQSACDTANKILACKTHQVINPFVERFGRLYEPHPLPKQYRRGQWRQCFANSYRMAVRHKLIYVEGLAMTSRSPLAVLHAWCADQEGRVLDRTWADGIAYLGVPIKTEFLKRIIRERKRRLGAETYYGMLNDWEEDYPLINLYGDTPDMWLAG